MTFQITFCLTYTYYADEIFLMSISPDPVNLLLKLNGDLQKRAIKWYITFKVTISKFGLLIRIFSFKNILGRAETVLKNGSIFFQNC